MAQEVKNVCVGLSVRMGVIMPGSNAFRPEVVYQYTSATKEGREELANITPRNAMKVAAAIGKRRLARENELVGYPMAIEAVFEDGSCVGNIA